MLSPRSTDVSGDSVEAAIHPVDDHVNWEGTVGVHTVPTDLTPTARVRE
jgi:hypothetical protein